MKGERQGRKAKHPVPWKEFARLMGAIREQVRDYPQEALEEIFHHLDMIEKRYGLAESTSDELSHS